MSEARTNNMNSLTQIQWEKVLNTRKLIGDFEEWFEFTKNRYHLDKPDTVRRGEYWWAELDATRPDIALDVMVRPGVDPSQNEENLARFFCFVEDMW